LKDDGNKELTNSIYGMHLTLRIGQIARREALESGEAVGGLLKTLVGRIGMRVLAGPMVAEESGDIHHRGWSGVVILYESHAAIHTYPDVGEVFMDIFSCKTFDLNTVRETLTSFFGEHIVMEQDMQDRGIHWGTDVDQELNSWHEGRLPALAGSAS
jgi:S-adenosylmethionine decarboxylase